MSKDYSAITDVDREAMDRIARRTKTITPPSELKPPKEVAHLENRGQCAKCMPCCFAPYYCCPPPHPIGRPVHFDVIEPYLDTGDVVLFVGADISNLIRVMSKSRWSHVGVVVRDEAYPDVLMFEATKDHEVDVDSGEMANGVQLVKLRDRLQNYETEKFAIRRLLDFPRTTQTQEAIHSIKKDFKGRPFENDWVSFVKAGYDGWGGKNKKEDLSALFCSELVAEVYERIGVLPKFNSPDDFEKGAVPSNEYSPVDFQEGSKLKLKKGRFGPEIPITFNAKARGSAKNSFADSKK